MMAVVRSQASVLFVFSHTGEVVVQRRGRSVRPVSRSGGWLCSGFEVVNKTDSVQ